MPRAEIIDITISLLVLSFFFAIPLTISLSTSIPISFIVSLFTFGFGFVGHEMAHKSLAQYSGFLAEFHIIKQGMLMIIISGTIGVVLSIVFHEFIPIIFGYPGAVFIVPSSRLLAVIQETAQYPEQRKIIEKWIAFIKSAGVITNLVLAVIFLFILSTNLGSFAYFGYRINSGLAFFNVLPFEPLDGASVFKYYRKLWLLMFGLALLFFFIS